MCILSTLGTGSLSPSTAPSWEVLHPGPLQGTGGTHTLPLACELIVDMQVHVYQLYTMEILIFLELLEAMLILSHICSCMEVLWTLQPHLRS